jgi:hypothetical protein
VLGWGIASHHSIRSALSHTSLARISRAGLGGVMAKRSHRVIQKITNEAGNNTIFTPVVL